MSKKPVPGLMGDAKLLSGVSIQEARIGARRITRIAKIGDDGLHRGLIDAGTLLGGAFGDVGVFVL